MDVRLTTEQTELRDAADRMVSDLGVASVGDLDDLDRRGRFDAAITQAGWRMLRTGEPDAPLASGVEAALVARSLARGASDVAFLGPVLAHDLLRRAGGGDETDRTIAMDRSMQRLAAPGESAVVVDLHAVGATLALCGDQLIEVPTPAATDGVDLTRGVAAVDLLADGSEVGPVSADDLLAWEALGTALTAADLLGAMEGAVRLTTDYAKERQQFKVAIGSFQAVQHLLAEAATLIEGAYSAVLYAAWAADALEPVEARQAAAMAKAYTSRSARTVCETAIQVHGGIGNTWECLAHVHLRRCLLSTEWFGGEAPNLTLLAQQRWGAA